MYVNGESGYLVAPEDIAGHYDDGSLSIETDAHENLPATEQRASAARVLVSV
jgi:hypothetical protein